MKQILQLYQSQNTVFDFATLGQIFSISNKQVLKNKIQTLKKKNILFSPTRKLYALPDKPINTFELANKMYSPSYISFFSALYHHAMIFQYQNDVFLAYQKSDTKKVLDFEIHLKHLKREILLNPSGIHHTGMCSIASPERAFLDTLYLYGAIHFDNLSMLDVDKIQELLPMYKNKKLIQLSQPYLLK